MSAVEMHDGLRICGNCRRGYHGDCSDYALWDGHDIRQTWGIPDDAWCQCDHDSNGVLVDWVSPRIPLAAPPGSEG